MQVVRRKLSGAADGTTAGSKTALNHAMLDLFGSIIWYEERSPKMHQCQSIIMVLYHRLGMEGRTHPGSVWI